jgi:hypothetical protein
VRLKFCTQKAIKCSRAIFNLLSTFSTSHNNNIAKKINSSLWNRSNWAKEMKIKERNLEFNIKTCQKCRNNIYQCGFMCSRITVCCLYSCTLGSLRNIFCSCCSFETDVLITADFSNLSPSLFILLCIANINKFASKGNLINNSKMKIFQIWINFS